MIERQSFIGNGGASYLENLVLLISGYVAMISFQCHHGQCGFGLLALALIFVVGGACGKLSNDIKSTEPSALHSLYEETEQARSAVSPEARTYLEAALDTIQVHHALGPRYDWEEWRLAVLEHAPGASSYADTYESIIFALEDLKDRHRAFRPPASPHTAETIRQLPDDSLLALSLDRLEAKLIHDRVGLIVLPGFRPTDTNAVNVFASEIQRLIREIDAYDPCGWIVDLRHNGGGNMWPMLAGIGPVLGEGHLGSGVTRNGLGEAWYYEDGKAKLDTLVLASVDDPYTQRHPHSPVAVLIGRHTGSSGEAVVIAFRGRAATRFFGSATAGATSSPKYFDLIDGAMLGFAVAFLADRAGRTYAGPIEPEIHIAGESWQEPDRVQEAAVQWLEKQSACQAHS